ncbi:MAG: hypothetical protein KF833_24025 [Verrucomicrobiae bacterium]|nr:hypothetical protein [Verrucomicrobiae bacterium]
MSRKRIWLLVGGILAVTGVAALLALAAAAQFILNRSGMNLADLRALLGNPAAAHRADAEARERDPRWQPSCQEIAVIRPAREGVPGEVRNFVVDTTGRLLVTVVAPEGEAAGIPAGTPGALLRFSAAGKLEKALPLDLRPNAIALGPDGTVFVGGSGRLLHLDAGGRVLATAGSPVAQLAVSLTPELEEMARDTARHTQRPAEEELDRLRRSLDERRAVVGSLAATDRDLFVALPAPQDFTWRVYRYDLDLTRHELVAERLRGCCGEMNLGADADSLYVAHNGRHRVERRNRDGREVAQFGRPGKTDPAHFGGCCEPKNLRVLADGDVLVGESGPPTCIKRFSASGEFIEVLAVTGSSGDCVRMTVDVSPDGRQFYLLDTKQRAIRVFARKG